MESESVKISAVICTHNRAKYLYEAVKSLVDQNLPKEFYEIIIVDNSSIPSAKGLNEEFRKVRNLKYIYEPILGLSQARNRGWKIAKGEYVAYLDDDAIASKDWLKNILDASENTGIKPGCVGGKIGPIWELSRPRWIHKELEVFLSILDYSDKPKILDEGQNLFGTNIAFPRKVLEEFAGFSTSLGREGERLVSGEEALLQQKIRDSGYKIFYDPKISVKHHILESRLNKKWFIKRMYYEGISNALMDIYIKNPSNLNKLWLAIKKILSFVILLKEMICHLVRNRDPKWFFYRCISMIRMGYIARILNLNTLKSSKQK